MKIIKIDKSAETDKMRATATMNMLGSRWMENTKSFFIIMCLLTIITTQVIVPQKARADEPKEYTKVLFWVEDALGNKDSCLFIGTPTATDGIDEHLGEVNLYGVPPTKELDIRIVQRTEVFNSEQDIDLKADYRWQEWDTTYIFEHFFIKDVVLEIYAKHYPVDVYFSSIIMPYNNHYFYIYEKNGICKHIIMCEDWMGSKIDTNESHKIWNIDSEYENYFILIELRTHVGIKDETQTLSVFPNPSNNYIFIEHLENEEIYLLDANANSICSFFTLEKPYKLDVSNLPTGIYHLTTKKNILLNTFIKER